MIECVAISVGDDESGIALALRPVERKRDLVRPLLHSCAVAAGSASLRVAGCVVGCGLRLRPAAAASAGGLLDEDWICTTVPAVSTTQPRADSAAASWLMSPLYLTRM